MGRPAPHQDATALLAACCQHFWLEYFDIDQSVAGKRRNKPPGGPGRPRSTSGPPSTRRKAGPVRAAIATLLYLAIEAAAGRLLRQASGHPR